MPYAVRLPGSSRHKPRRSAFRVCHLGRGPGPHARAVMAPRGPDSAGVWSGRVALGHRRLRIIDLSEAGAQPMVDAELGLTIAWNGCIYNYQELRQELHGHGYRFSRTATLRCCSGLPPLGRPLRQPSPRNVRVRHRGTRQRPGVTRPGPLGIKPLYLTQDSRRIRSACASAGVAGRRRRRTRGSS